MPSSLSIGAPPKCFVFVFFVSKPVLSVVSRDFFAQKTATLEIETGSDRHRDL